jgi:DNA processing protein
VIVAGAPAWASQDRLARAAWSRLVEPGDVVAGAAVSALGVVEALGHVRTGAPLPDVVAELLEERGTRSRLDAALSRWRARVEQLAPERDVATVERFGGRLVVPTDPEWPEALDDLGLSTPPCLWVLGGHDVGTAVRGAVAMVGARASTGYGEHVGADMAAGLVDRGITVVSGGAFGIDAAAHRGALAAGGTTVAVLACGVDKYYPRAHEGLLRRIAEDGLVVAEVPPGSMPSRGRFLQRNRLIAALAGATVVVEAAWRSGALVTASQAAGLGRGLGAVPGPVTSAASAGCHRILRDLAGTCVTDASEAAELVRPLGTVEPTVRPVAAADHDGLSETDLLVLDALPVRGAATVASLGAVAGLPQRSVEAGLGRLQLEGLAEALRSDGSTLYRRGRRRAEPALRPRAPGRAGGAPGSRGA